MNPTFVSWRRWLPPAAVAAVTVLAFLPSLRGEFLIWDDDANFLYNPSYRGLGLQQLRWMFTHAYGHYMPLTWLTLGLDYVLWGMNPAGYHATSLAFHALNAVLFYLLLHALLRRALPDLTDAGLSAASAAGALFFSIHPLRVESVSWITERRDVVSGAFFLLTLLFYVRMTEQPERRVRWLALSLLSFAAMLLSKTMGLTLPFVLLVMDVYPLRRFSRATAVAMLREKIPYLLLMIGGLAMLSVTAGQAEGVSNREEYPLSRSLAQPGHVLSFYVWKTLLPLRLSPLYWYRPGIGAAQIGGWIALLAVTAALVAARRRCPAALAAWLSFGILIAPASGLVQFGSIFAADRYTYLACLPFAALFSALLVLLSRWKRPAVVVAGAAAVLIALGGSAAAYARVWVDSVSLWTRAIERDPDVYFSRAYRGRALAARGDLTGALADFDRSIDLHPAWFESRGWRADARLGRGDASGALADAVVALRLRPDWAEGLKIRGVALARLGKPREAIADFTSALKLRPQFMDARVQRANERARIGDLDGAISDFDAAIDFDPQPHLFHRRGMTKAARGDLPGAVADFGRALELAPPGWPARASVEEMLQRARSELKR